MYPKTTFENVAIWIGEDTGSLVIACKDRAVHDGGSWVVASLSEEEVVQVYEYLQQYFTMKKES